MRARDAAVREEPPVPLGRGPREVTQQHTHRKAIVRKSSSSFVLLVELFFAADGMFHKVHRLQERTIH